MSDVQLYLLEADKNKLEAQRIAIQSAAKLERKELKLIDLITSLEQYINDKDDGPVRAKSVAYLADVLSAIAPKVLSGQERRLLCDFILGRIENDHEGVASSARALLALEERGKWDPATAQRVLQTFLDQTHPLKRFKLQTERYALLQLIDVLVAKYRNALKQLHDSDATFMNGFISYFDGEKDPRNLMIVFSVLQVPMTEWDVRAHAQDLFESVFNYFPITFKPPPDDPYGITAQDLKDRLRGCIAATSDFAPYAIPALLDKLDSNSLNTKRDVLQALKACISNYEPKTINLYSVTLWDALKFEVLGSEEEDLAQEALNVLSSIALKFATDMERPLSNYLRPIIKECNEHLEDAPTKQSAASGRILNAVAKSNGAVADRCTKGILPTLFALYEATASIHKRRGLIEVYNQIVAAYLSLGTISNSSYADGLQDFSENAVTVLLRAIVNAPKAEVSFRLAALDGLTQLTAVNAVFAEKAYAVVSDMQMERLVDAVTDLVINERIDGHGDIRERTIKSLIEISHNVPILVRDRSVPAFMVELPDAPQRDEAFSPALEAFAQLSKERQIFDTVVIRLRNKLEAAKVHGASKSYQLCLLFALLYAFVEGSPMPDESGMIRSAYFAEYAEPLIQQILHSGEDEVAKLEAIGRICNTIIRPQSVHFQASVYSRYRELLVPSSPQSTEGLDLIRKASPFSLFWFAAMRPEIAEAYPDDIISLLTAQSRILTVTDVDAVHANILQRHVCVLVNKFAKPKAMQSLLHRAGIEVESLLANGRNPGAVRVAFSVTKALIIQGKTAALVSKYIQLLLDCLSRADESVARRFAILLAPDDILSKANHCVISGLYKQKTFSQTVPHITTAIRPADSSTKAKLLTALSGILRWLPYSVIQPSLITLVPPLLQSLDSSVRSHAGDINSTSLTIIESTLMHDPQVLFEHVASLITRLLNATAAPANSAKVRAGALQCLTLVPRQMKPEAVVPYRRQVVKRLLASLDDAKRSVRVEAVRCRTAWLDLDEAKDEDE